MNISERSQEVLTHEDLIKESSSHKELSFSKLKEIEFQL